MADKQDMGYLRGSCVFRVSNRQSMAPGKKNAADALGSILCRCQKKHSRETRYDRYVLR